MSDTPPIQLLYKRVNPFGFDDQGFITIEHERASESVNGDDWDAKEIVIRLTANATFEPAMGPSFTRLASIELSQNHVSSLNQNLARLEMCWEEMSGAKRTEMSVEGAPGLEIGFREVPRFGGETELRCFVRLKFESGGEAEVTSREASKLSEFVAAVRGRREV